MKKPMNLAKRELIELMNDIAQATVSAGAAAQDINYFHATEKLLYNYKRLEALVENEQEYLELEPARVSTSLVRMAPSIGGISSPEPMEQLQQRRMISYERTKMRFNEIAQVVKLFEKEREFVIVRMYYFNEDSEGNPRADDNRFTWEEMMFELSEANILHDTKTARKWRNRIINDMAICLFGKPAAISAARHLTRCSG